MAGEMEIEPGEYSWKADSRSKKTKFTLKIDPKVSIRKGLKVAVCGPVGLGKSSLLYSIMGCWVKGICPAELMDSDWDSSGQCALWEGYGQELI